MAKLTYWTAQCLTDSDAYSVREKTKKAAVAELESRDPHNDYGPVHKVTVEYKDAFDLMTLCMEECSGYWE